jgi:preprotein translocase subunit SecG
MKNGFLIAQIVTGVIVTTLILLQAKGVGFGHSLSTNSYHSRRGMEFIVFRATILISVVFVVTAIAAQLFI